MTALSAPVLDRTVVAEFPSTVTADIVDTCLARAFADAALQDLRRIHLDLRPVRFVDPAALQMLIAAVLRLKTDGFQATLRIPRDRKLRDFWRAWGFPNALNDALGTNEFHRMVAVEDRHLFGERQEHYLPSRLPAHPGFGGDTIRSSNFFGFHTERLRPGTLSTRLAYVEKDSWNIAHIRSVLSSKLGSGSAYFSSRIVFEAMLNAMTHPGARIVQTASLDAGGTSHASGSFFTTHFWDDGLSMGETLRRAIDQGTSQRCSVEPDFDRKYLVVYSSDDAPQDEVVSVERGSECDLAPGLTPHRALFATLLPGVTSDPHGESHSVAQETLAEDVRYGRRGMGLFVLVNAVVEVLGGSVSFRTGRYFMNVRRTKVQEAESHEGSTIRVRIKKRPEALPDFVGNLVTVRVRTQNAT